MSKSFLEFVDVTQQGDYGQRHLIKAMHHGDVLGLVKWYPAWRQYVLEPEMRSVWSAGCLADVERFMRGLPLPQKGAGG